MIQRLTKLDRERLDSIIIDYLTRYGVETPQVKNLVRSLSDQLWTVNGKLKDRPSTAKTAQDKDRTSTTSFTYTTPSVATNSTANTTSAYQEFVNKIQNETSNFETTETNKNEYQNSFFQRLLNTLDTLQENVKDFSEKKNEKGLIGVGAESIVKQYKTNNEKEQRNPTRIEKAANWYLNTADKFSEINDRLEQLRQEKRKYGLIGIAARYYQNRYENSQNKVDTPVTNITQNDNISEQKAFKNIEENIIENQTSTNITNLNKSLPEENKTNLKKTLLAKSDNTPIQTNLDKVITEEEKTAQERTYFARGQQDQTVLLKSIDTAAQNSIQAAMHNAFEPLFKDFVTKFESTQKELGQQPNKGESGGAGDGFLDEFLMWRMMKKMSGDKNIPKGGSPTPKGPGMMGKAKNFLGKASRFLLPVATAVEGATNIYDTYQDVSGDESLGLHQKIGVGGAALAGGATDVLTLADPTTWFGGWGGMFGEGASKELLNLIGAKEKGQTMGQSLRERSKDLATFVNTKTQEVQNNKQPQPSPQEVASVTDESEKLPGDHFVAVKPNERKDIDNINAINQFEKKIEITKEFRDKAYPIFEQQEIARNKITSNEITTDEYNAQTAKQKDELKALLQVKDNNEYNLKLDELSEQMGVLVGTLKENPPSRLNPDTNKLETITEPQPFPSIIPQAPSPSVLQKSSFNLTPVDALPKIKPEESFSSTINNVTNSSIDNNTLTNIAENTETTNNKLQAMSQAILELAKSFANNRGQSKNNLFVNGAPVQQPVGSASIDASTNDDAIRRVRQMFLAT